MYAMNNGNNLASLIGQLCIGHSGLASISSRSSSGSIISDNSSISSINSNSISSSSNRSTRSGSNASSGSVNICTGDSWWVRLYMTWPIQGHTSNIKIITSPLGMGSWLVVLLLIVRYFFLLHGIRPIQENHHDGARIIIGHLLWYKPKVTKIVHNHSKKYKTTTKSNSYTVSWQLALWQLCKYVDMFVDSS